MPIESIEIEKKLPNKITLGLAVFAASLAMSGEVATGAEEMSIRPAPSGETCIQKVGYYARHGAIHDKVSPSDCKNRPQIGRNIAEIEKAGRYFNANPIGAVSVAACESGLTETAKNPSGATGLFQQMSGYWYSRVSKTQSYINQHSGKNHNLKLSTEIKNPRANAFTSVYMMSRRGGSSNWAPSRHCWSNNYSQVAGSQRLLSSWFATSPKKKTDRDPIYLT